MPTHNPVPFDFVPFATQSPALRKTEDWESEGKLLSGRIDYTLKTLTPLHIVGQQKSSGSGDQLYITASKFNRNGGKAIIPGTSIKGMLRAFFEALTNSWVGQATKNYAKKERERQYAITAWGEPAKEAIDGIPAIPKRFHPIAKGDRIDVASFLFGLVAESADGEKSEGEESPAFKSRVFFEDIIFDEQVLDSSIIKLPDIPGKAFMGGPKPRKNNWWYFKPHSIRKRIVYTPKGPTPVADFIGGEFWGRKFYYHQKPEQVLRWYDDKKNWPHTTEKKKQWINYYYTYPVETMPTSTESNGSIYFEFVPAPLLSLFLFALQPNNPIKHKLGYGKAFGLGSVEFRNIKVEAVESTGLSVVINSMPTQTEESECLKYIHTNSFPEVSLNCITPPSAEVLPREN
jgi:CRISPR/Cas system CSM-associated protein Csm3 (group 7 of RAMP superfamily)